MTDDGKRYRHRRTPPHGYPVARDPDAMRPDGTPVSFVDESSGVVDMPPELRDPFARGLDSALKKYHALVEPSRNELASLHSVTSRLHALVEDLGLPMLKDLLARADKIERSTQSAAAKLDAFIEYEFKPAKKELAKIPGIEGKVSTMESDIGKLRDQFAAAEKTRLEDRRTIEGLRKTDEDRLRAMQRASDVRAGERRITKKILWLASTSAGALGMVIAKFGDQLLQLLKGIL